MSGRDLKKEFGDYQTPISFANEVCTYLHQTLGLRPLTIIEPNSGIGNFIKASLKQFDTCRSVFGIEINRKYCNECNENNPDQRVNIINSNFFDYDISQLIPEKGEILIVGNPPWATNSKLNFNLPEKVNFKGLSGTDAITGASNFDICEYIILQLIENFKSTDTTIAMLCKTSVARNVFLELNRNGIAVEYVKMLNFNSTEVFNISASACLLVIKFSNTVNNANICEVSDISAPEKIISKIRCKNGVLALEAEGIEDLEGICQLEWRQGVKHDCSSVMELEKVDSSLYKNKKKEIIELEEILVFPLMKSSNFKSHIIKDGFKKYVIVTQKKAREDTSYIENVAPLTWKYLNDNKALFDNRKSSIYNGAPAFSMFGVGDYSYAEYKVGISGFYKKPVFSLLYNEGNVEHPVMLDDTTYFISFENYDLAYTCMLLLNSCKVQEFLCSISFQDAKRPYTKKVLQRLDIKKSLQCVKYEEVLETECVLGLPAYLTVEMYDNLVSMFA